MEQIKAEIKGIIIIKANVIIAINTLYNNSEECLFIQTKYLEFCILCVLISVDMKHLIVRSAKFVCAIANKTAPLKVVFQYTELLEIQMRNKNFEESADVGD